MASTAAGDEPAVRPRCALEELAWDETFVRELPADPRSDNIPRQVLSSPLLCSLLTLYKLSRG
jgi:hypothetical protein